MPSTHRRTGGTDAARGCPDVQALDARRTPGHAHALFKFKHLPLARLVHLFYASTDPTPCLDAR